MALAAVGTQSHVKDAFFYEPIILPEKASREVQLTLHPLDEGNGWKFQVHSRAYGVKDADWSLNADGTPGPGRRRGRAGSGARGAGGYGDRADGAHESARALRDI